MTDLRPYILKDDELSFKIAEIETFQSSAYQLKSSFLHSDFLGFSDFHDFISFNKTFFIDPEVQKSMDNFHVKGSSLFVTSPDNERRCYITKEANYSLCEYLQFKRRKFYEYEKYDDLKFQHLTECFHLYLRISRNDFGFKQSGYPRFNDFDISDFRKVYVSLLIKIDISPLIIKKLIGMPMHADEQKKAKLSVKEIQEILYQYYSAYRAEVKSLNPKHIVEFFF